MRKTALSIVLAGALTAPALVSAQASVDIRLNLPVVLPQLVVVSPGVQVVPEVDEEVFFVSGFYWVRHDSGWYRSRNPRGGWVVAPVRAVPVALVKMPPGKYKRYKPAKLERASDRGFDRGGGDDHGYKLKGKKHGKH